VSPLASNDDAPLWMLNEAHQQAAHLRQHIEDHEMARAPIHVSYFPARRITGAQLAWKAAGIASGSFLAGLLLYGALAVRAYVRARWGM